MRTNENGRSMVEMLGVLAIIGVLSVGGIYGYTTAMRKYKANEIVQAASMLVTVAKSMNAGEGGTATITDISSTTTIGGTDVSGMTVTASSSDATPAVTIGIDMQSELGRAICQIAPRTSAAVSAAGYSIAGCEVSG